MRQDFLIIQNSPNISYDINGNQLYLDDIDKIIKTLCLEYGSTVEGRKESLKFYTGFNYKLPIIISNKYHLYYLCTRSLEADDCVLINYQFLKAYHSLGNATKLIFKNDFEIIVPVDYRIIKRQIKILNKYLNEVLKRCYNSSYE